MEIQSSSSDRLNVLDILIIAIAISGRIQLIDFPDGNFGFLLI